MPPRWLDSDVWAQVAFYTGLGFIIPGAALAGAVLGWLVNRALHTSLGLEVAGALVGVAAGIFEILRILARSEKNEENGKNRREKKS